eukprot:1912043-Prymnesium_polylepis.1
MKASRAQWPSLVREKIVAVLPRLLPLDLLLSDVAKQPALLIRELHAVGDAVLPGDTAQELVFDEILRVRDYVADNYTEYFRSSGRRQGLTRAVQAAH